MIQRETTQRHSDSERTCMSDLVEEHQLLIFHLRQKEDMLDMLTTQIVENQELLREVTSSLKDVVEFLPIRHRETMQALLDRLETQSNSDGAWQNILHSNSRPFADILAKRFPTLTEREKQICAFTRSKYFSSNFVAQFLGISIRTLQKHRFNIRKKLGLRKEQSLHVFLRSMY